MVSRGAECPSLSHGVVAADCLALARRRARASQQISKDRCAEGKRVHPEYEWMNADVLSRPFVEKYGVPHHGGQQSARGAFVPPKLGGGGGGVAVADRLAGCIARKQCAWSEIAAEAASQSQSDGSSASHRLAACRCRVCAPCTCAHLLPDATATTN